MCIRSIGQPLAANKKLPSPCAGPRIPSPAKYVSSSWRLTTDVLTCVSTAACICTLERLSRTGIERIDALDFPEFRTELSRAYDVAIGMYELDADNPRTCDYYDFLMDFAPSPQATR